MKNIFPTVIQFIVNCFLIAVFINAVVSTAHIVKDKDFTFFESIQVFLFALGTSALFFVAICFLLYLLVWLIGMGREKTFWIVMIAGITLTLITYRVFKEIFYKYTEPGYIAAIAAFSLMVGLASQYQFFHRPEPDNK